MLHSLSHSVGGDSSAQKDMLISSQEEVLRRRLSLQIPSAAPMTASSPEFQSLSSSPTFSRLIYSSSSAPSLDYASSDPIGIPAQPNMTHQHRNNGVHAEDSHTLNEINQNLKATLTELLNTESVRADEKYRAWIQERLMDAEQKIRRQRRRRSSNSSGEELASFIAEHIDHHITPCKTWG